MVNLLLDDIYGNGTIRFPNAQFQILSWLRFTYSFFNLELFNINQLSFCIWKGAGVMDILMVKLGSILFSLALVVFTVFVLKQHKFAKYFPCLSRRRFSVINGISAFYILCYAQCVKACFQVLVRSCLYNENYECTRHDVFYSGNMSSFQGPHIKYVAVAVLFIIFIVILPPVLLLFYPLFFKALGLCGLSESKVAIYLWKIMPIQLLDSFQNPFKDNCFFFAGLYFLYRAIASAGYILAQNLVQYYCIILLEFTIVTFLHSVFQPYKERLFNIIDALLFLNLALINGITLYNYLMYALERDHHNYWIAVQIVLLLLPLISVAIYLIGELAMQVKKRHQGSGNADGYRELSLSISRE